MTPRIPTPEGLASGVVITNPTSTCDGYSGSNCTATDVRRRSPSGSCHESCVFADARLFSSGKSTYATRGSLDDFLADIFYII